MYFGADGPTGIGFLRINGSDNSGGLRYGIEYIAITKQDNLGYYLSDGTNVYSHKCSDYSYDLFPAITYTPTDSIPVDTTVQSFPITARLDGDTLRQITYSVTKAPAINLDLRVLIWDGTNYTAAFSGTIPAGQRSVTISGAVAVATDERIFPEILTDSGASGLDLELKFQKP